MAVSLVMQFLWGVLRWAAARLALLSSSQQSESLQRFLPSKQPLGLGLGVLKGFASGLFVAFSGYGLMHATPVSWLPAGEADLLAWAPSHLHPWEDAPPAAA